MSFPPEICKINKQFETSGGKKIQTLTEAFQDPPLELEVLSYKHKLLKQQECQ